MLYEVNTALRTTILSDGTAEKKLEDILEVMEEMTFGLRKAAVIVGSGPRLTRLMDEGKIRFSKDFKVQNGKYFLNASDVLRYARPGYRTRKRA